MTQNNKPAQEADAETFSIEEDVDDGVNGGSPAGSGASNVSYDDLLGDTLAAPVGGDAISPFDTPSPVQQPGDSNALADLILQPDVPEQPARTGSLKVLLAGAAAAYYGPIVGRAGYDVTVVESGVECLAGLDSMQPDLVVTTLDLGDLSGLELMKAAQEVHPEVKFILVDDPSFPQQIVAALGEGAVAFVPAGSPDDKLIAALHRAAERIRGRAPAAIPPSRPPAPVLPSWPTSLPPISNDPATPALSLTSGAARGWPPMGAMPTPLSMPQMPSVSSASPTITMAATPGPIPAPATPATPTVRISATPAPSAGLNDGELSSARARVASLEAELSASRQQLNAAEQMSQKWQQQAHAIQQQAASVAAQAHALQQQQQQTAQDGQRIQQMAQQQLSSMSTRIMQLEQELAAARTGGGDSAIKAAYSQALDAQQAAEARVAEVEGRLASVEIQRDQLQEHLMATEGARQQLESQYLALDAARVQIETQYIAAETGRQQLEHDLAMLNAQFGGAQSELAAARQNFGALLDQKSVAEARLANVEAQNQGDGLERSHLQQEIMQLRARLSAAEADLSAARGAYAGMLDQKQAAESKASMLEARAQSMEVSRAQMEPEVAALRSRLANVESDLTSTRTTLQSALEQKGSTDARMQSAEARALAAEQARTQAEQSLKTAWGEIDTVKQELRKAQMELITSHNSSPPASVASPEQVKEAVDKALAEIRRLVEAVAPLTWGVEQATTYIESVGNGAEKEQHARQLKLLLKVLGKLKDKAEQR